MKHKTAQKLAIFIIAFITTLPIFIIIYSLIKKLFLCG